MHAVLALKSNFESWDEWRKLNYCTNIKSFKLNIVFPGKYLQQGELSQLLCFCYMSTCIACVSFFYIWNYFRYSEICAYSPYARSLSLAKDVIMVMNTPHFGLCGLSYGQLYPLFLQCFQCVCVSVCARACGMVDGGWIVNVNVLLCGFLVVQHYSWSHCHTENCLFLFAKCIQVSPLRLSTQILVETNEPRTTHVGSIYLSFSRSSSPPYMYMTCFCIWKRIKLYICTIV